MEDKELIMSILQDMFYVSDEANPNNYPIEGKVTWKKLLDAKFGKVPSSKEIKDELDIYFDDLTEETAMEIYNDPEELNFWIYDRYNDGSCLLYIIYGEETSKWGTYEICVDEILPL